MIAYVKQKLIHCCLIRPTNVVVHDCLYEIRLSNPTFITEMIRQTFKLTCFKYLNRLKNCPEFKLYEHSSTGQWYWHFTSFSFFKMSFLLWCLDKCMSKLPVFLNTLLHPSSGQWIFVLITHNSDGGGHILTTFILPYRNIHRKRKRWSYHTTVWYPGHSVANTRRNCHKVSRQRAERHL
jgi:hypothetical protein